MRRDMSSSQAGRERRLTLRPSPADKGDMASARASRDERAFGARSRERGQAMVEFALIAPVLLLIVIGIIQFGVALNFWFDMQRIANQGARWAVVNCGPSGSTVCSPTLQTALENDIISSGNNPTVEICFESMTGNSGGTPVATVGDPVTVRLIEKYKFAPIVKVASVNLRATATMRLEQKPTSAALAGIGLCP